MAELPALTYINAIPSHTKRFKKGSLAVKGYDGCITKYSGGYLQQLMPGCKSYKILNNKYQNLPLEGAFALLGRVKVPLNVIGTTTIVDIPSGKKVAVDRVVFEGDVSPTEGNVTVAVVGGGSETVASNVQNSATGTTIIPKYGRVPAPATVPANNADIKTKTFTTGQIVASVTGTAAQQGASVYVEVWGHIF